MNYRFQGKCFNCGKMGHKSNDCRLPKNKKNHETNMMDDISKDVLDIKLVAMVSEVNLVGQLMVPVYSVLKIGFITYVDYV